MAWTNYLPLGHGQHLCEISFLEQDKLSDIEQHDSKELCFGHDFRLCVYCDIEYRDMTLVQGHDLGSRS